MGADLYLQKLYDVNHDKYEQKFHHAVEKRNNNRKPDLEVSLQKKVEKIYEKMMSIGYYRDSYNPTGLFNHLYLDSDSSMSWWKDISPLKNRNSEITNKNLEKFFVMLLGAELRLPSRSWVEQNLTLDDHENTMENWHKYYTKKYKDLINLVALAIEMDEPIFASL